MKIGELTESVGIATSTIRYYEKVGLIEAPSRVSGVRQFASEMTDTLRFIQLAQATGFELLEIKTLLDSFGQRGSTRAMRQDLAENKQRKFRARMAQLAKMDGILTRSMTCRCMNITTCAKAALDSVTRVVCSHLHFDHVA